MTCHYLNKAQSTIQDIQLLMHDDDHQKVLEKLDNLYMVFVRNGPYKDFESVWNQVLLNTEYPYGGEFD